MQRRRYICGIGKMDYRQVYFNGSDSSRRDGTSRANEKGGIDSYLAMVDHRVKLAPCGLHPMSSPRGTRGLGLDGTWGCRCLQAE